MVNFSVFQKQCNEIVFEYKMENKLIFNYILKIDNNLLFLICFCGKFK